MKNDVQVVNITIQPSIEITEYQDRIIACDKLMSPVLMRKMQIMMVEGEVITDDDLRDSIAMLERVNSYTLKG